MARGRFSPRLGLRRSPSNTSGHADLSPQSLNSPRTSPFAAAGKVYSTVQYFYSIQVLKSTMNYALSHGIMWFAPYPAHQPEPIFTDVLKTFRAPRVRERDPCPRRRSPHHGPHPHAHHIPHPHHPPAIRGSTNDTCLGCPFRGSTTEAPNKAAVQSVASNWAVQ